MIIINYVFNLSVVMCGCAFIVLIAHPIVCANINLKVTKVQKHNFSLLCDIVQVFSLGLKKLFEQSETLRREMQQQIHLNPSRHCVFVRGHKPKWLGTNGSLTKAESEGSCELPECHP